MPANWIVGCGDRPRPPKPIPSEARENFRAEAYGRYGGVATWEVRGSVERTVQRPVLDKGKRLVSSYDFRTRREGEYEITCTFVSEEGEQASVSWAVTVDDNEWPAYGRKVEPEEPGTMVFIKGGTFKMGRPHWAPLADDRPEHEVSLDDFYIGKYLVTAKEFCEFLNDRGNPDYRYLIEDEFWIEKRTEPSIRSNDYPQEGSWEYRWGERELESCPVFCEEETGKYRPRGNEAFSPVTQVTWFGAVEYCKWLSERTGRNYRLPAEAEWEYAARGKEGRKYPWGDEEPVPGGKGRDPGPFWADYGGGAPLNAAVGSFVVAYTPDGLADMAGAIDEWCSDAYSNTYYSVSPRDNPQGPEVLPEEWATAQRVLRNSASYAAWNGFWTTYWFDPAWVRQSLEPTIDGEHGRLSFSGTGFRVVMEPADKPGQAGGVE